MLQRERMILIGSSIISLGVGVALGGYFAKRQLESFYADRANEEIEEAQLNYYLAREELEESRKNHKALVEKELSDIRVARDKFNAANKLGPYETPTSAARKLIPDAIFPEEVVEALENYSGDVQSTRAQYNSFNSSDQGTEEQNEEPDEEPADEPDEEDEINDPGIIEEPAGSRIGPNVFGQTLQSFTASSDAPGRTYVISKTEFESGESGFDQNTLMYYEMDQVLTDPRDDSLENLKSTIEKPPAFGVLSRDPNVVYVRNERLRMEFEVVRNHGWFSVEVLGVDPDKSGG